MQLLNTIIQHNSGNSCNICSTSLSRSLAHCLNRMSQQDVSQTHPVQTESLLTVHLCIAMSTVSMRSLHGEYLGCVCSACHVACS